MNINDILATAFASRGTPSGGVKQSGVGARPGQDFDTYVKSMLGGLRMMRKTRIR